MEADRNGPDQLQKSKGLTTAQPSLAEHSFKSILASNRDLLSRCLVVSIRLLDKLSAVECMRDKIVSVRQLRRTDQQITELLNVLMEVPGAKQKQVFCLFLLALRLDGQEHVANIFRPQSDARPMSKQHYELLLRKQELLCRAAELNQPLLNKLLENGVLTRDDRQKLKIRSNYCEKISKLFNILLRKSDDTFDKLVEALNAVGQRHVAYLMTEPTFKSILIENHGLLSRCLVASPELLFKLKTVDCMRDTVSKIRQQKTSDQKVAELLNVLDEVPDSQQQSVFISLLSALRQDGQEHVANIFIPESDARPMSDKHYQLLIRKTEELCVYINPDYALLNRLLAVGVLNKREVDSVASKTIYTKMSTELVNILLRKCDNSFDKLIGALNSTEQQHVVHILTGQGESPLSRVRRLVLRKAHTRLVCKVDTLHDTSLLTELISSGVLTEDEKQRIAAHEVNDVRTTALIDAIARKSQNAYDKFIQALKDSGHREVAEELEGLELRGLIDPHFLSNTLLPDRKRIVKFVTNDMQALVTGTGDAIQAMTTLMQQNGFAVSQIKDGSIHISFICFTEESFENLKQLYIDKTLDKLITETFCPQFAGQGLESLTLRITDNEFKTLAEAFENFRKLTVLPLELLELVLMRMFIKLFNDSYKSQYKTHEAIALAYSTLAGVCSDWWQTMNGWPQSTTKHWFKHKLHRTLTFVCRPYVVSPRLQSSLVVPSGVYGVTVCDNKLFAVCHLPNSIFVFGPNNNKMANIELEQLKQPRDIVSCTETQQLYVVDWSRDSTRCVWRVSLDGRQVVKWLPNKSTATSQFTPVTLSVTSRRLLVTSNNNELLLYGVDGVELKRVPLPDMTSLQHAMETSHRTFIVCHWEPLPRVCEVNVDGHVTRVYCDQQRLPHPSYLSLDSDGRIFIADFNQRRVLLLNSETLELERVLLDKQHQLTWSPLRLCYSQQTRQLAVGGGTGSSGCVQFFAVR